MMFFKSIRWQLQVWHGLLLLMVVCAFVFTAWQLEKTERMNSIDAELQQRLSALVNTLRATPRAELPQGHGGGPLPLDEKQITTLTSAPALRSLFGNDGGHYFVIWMRDARPVAQSASAPQDVPRPTLHDATPRLRGDHFREAYIFAAPVDCVLVGRSVADVNAAILSHTLLLAGAGAALLLFGLAIGWWLTTRTLRPVREISDTAARIAGGDLSQRINILETESELGALAAVLNSTFSRLDAAFSQQSRFTSDAAHELRTPLTVLLTQTQATLMRERSAEEYRDALLSNISTAQRMRRLVESLLELARFEAGQEPLRREPCDLALIAADCAELLRPLADARQIALHSDLAETCCDADPNRIAQVLMNLIKNAIDYNHENREVRLTTRKEGGFASIEVADSGVGISNEDMPRIFERFYRADSARSDCAMRSGLGLAISKAIIETHGGSITVRRNGERGMAFTVSLPVVLRH